MTKTKKAPAGVAAPMGAKERVSNGSIPNVNSTQFSAARQVSTYLLRGEVNAIPARELAKLMGYRDTRPLRFAVERERRAGELILSGDSGYYLPSLDETQAEREVARYVRLMDARVRTNRLAVQPCKAYLRRRKRREIVGQAGLFDERGDEE